MTQAYHPALKSTSVFCDVCSLALYFLRTCTSIKKCFTLPAELARNAFLSKRCLHAYPAPPTPPPSQNPGSCRQPPNALVFQLKRFGFTNTANKIKHHVLFGNKLKLDVSGPERSAAYDLTG